jgi:hypothetical protein
MIKFKHRDYGIGCLSSFEGSLKSTKIEMKRRRAQEEITDIFIRVYKKMFLSFFLFYFYFFFIFFSVVYLNNRCRECKGKRKKKRRKRKT